MDALGKKFAGTARSSLDWGLKSASYLTHAPICTVHSIQALFEIPRQLKVRIMGPSYGTMKLRFSYVPCFGEKGHAHTSQAPEGNRQKVC